MRVERGWSMTLDGDRPVLILTCFNKHREFEATVVSMSATLLYTIIAIRSWKGREIEI